MQNYEGRHIVRQNVLNRATEILIARGYIKPDGVVTGEQIIAGLKWFTDELEKIVLDQANTPTK